MRDDVDTDQIMPKQFLKRIERSGFGEFLFFDWAQGARLGPAGSARSSSPARNFGCGSSREHAPWGARGLRLPGDHRPELRRHLPATTAPKIGLLPVTLPEQDVRAIADAGEAQIDLAAQEVRWIGEDGVQSASFEIDAETKRRLLNGIDDIDLTLQQSAAIASYEADRERSGPVTTSLV